MEDFWFAKAKRLQAIACTGLAYCDDGYERERLQETLDIANGMLARLATAPVERIAQLPPTPAPIPRPRSTCAPPSSATAASCWCRNATTAAGHCRAALPRSAIPPPKTPKRKSWRKPA
ncbi:NUDIX hydrolase N-terminal domain-containing protein [Achromobacter xylosoxidans]